MKAKLTPVFLVIVGFLFIFSLAPTRDVTAGGSLEVGTTTYTVDQPMVVYLTGMTAGGDYGLDFTAGCNTLKNFTLGLQNTELSFSVELSAPTSGDICLISLLEYNEYLNVSTTVDSTVLSATSAADIFPDEMIIAIGITVFVISIIVSIVTGIKVSKALKK